MASFSNPAPLQIEYRNKTCVVVRRSAARWDWAVDVDAHTVRGGQAATRQAAIEAAQRLVDRVLGSTRQDLTLVEPSGDGHR